MSDDIFRLLLILLLIISDRETSCGCNNNSIFSTLNTLIIVSLLFKTDEIGNGQTNNGTQNTNTTSTSTNGIFPT